jgi:hypothetical protein
MVKKVHHKVCTSRAVEGFDTDVDENKEDLPDEFHTNWHRIFRNKLPHEQLALWLAMNREVITELVEEMVDSVSRLRQDEFYHERVLKKK